MTKLYVTEIYIAPEDKVIGNVAVANLPAATTQALTPTSTSGQSAAFGASTRFVRLHADVAVHVKVGSDPTATTSDLRLAADATEYFGVTPGDKIAVILA